MRFFLTITFLLSCTLAYSQDLAGFVQVIAKDSLKLYINSSGILTNSQCAAFYRVAKMHPTYYVFHGPFKDYYATGELAVEGVYNGNSFQGAYREYYKNGQLKERGNFVNSVKTGVWEYWYENGQVKKVLNFQDGTPLVLKLFNAKGKALIVDGNGKYEEANPVLKSTVKGNIVDGKQDGKWQVLSNYSNTLTAEEVFENGRFIEGQSIAKIASFSSKYHDAPKATVDFTQDKVSSYSHYTNCKAFLGKDYTFHPKRYNSKYTDLPFLNHIYESFNPMDGLEGYILAGFKLDKGGKVADIKLHSTINNSDVEADLIRVLSSGDKWSPEMVNGKPIETSDLYAFSFSGNSYRILNDSRNSYPPVETGAAPLKNERTNFPDLVLETLKHNSKAIKSYTDVAVTTSFTVDEAGSIRFDDSTFEGMLESSEAEKSLYAIFKQALQAAGPWQPATANGIKVKHHFLAVLNMKDGTPRIRVFSNNWVLNDSV